MKFYTAKEILWTDEEVYAVLFGYFSSMTGLVGVEQLRRMVRTLGTDDMAWERIATYGYVMLEARGELMPPKGEGK